ncbi:MAG: RluA family pseudouridine synthase [Ktedonobacterales bacterium]
MLYEDTALLVVAKPAGMVTHPAYKHPDDTLADAIFARQTARGEGRPWLLHRLDRDTSGVMLFAKTMPARRSLVRQFERHSVRKLYLAVIALHNGASLVCDGGWGELNAPLRRDPADRRRVIVAPDGQSATTRYRLLATTPACVIADRCADPAMTLAVRGTVEAFGLALVAPMTGRTHQIRAHFAAASAPLLGDTTYLPEDSPLAGVAPRGMLHAWLFTCRYPGTGAPFSICASPPDDLLALIERLELSAGIAADTLAHALAGLGATEGEQVQHSCATTGSSEPVQ